jgi:carbon monoxide dehydrogenase subunit G
VKIEGSQPIAAPRPRVYEVLINADTVAKIIPGCERLTPTGDNTYQVQLRPGLAALSGVYHGTVTLSEQRPPEHLRLTLTSKGSWGFADGDGHLALEEQDGQTLVRYSGELKVGGLIAAVGQRLLDAAARKLMGEFFKNLASQAQTG